jgi:hypothetical protein
MSDKEAAEIKVRISLAVKAAMEAENRLGALQNHRTALQRGEGRDRDFEAMLTEQIKEETANIETATGHIMRLLNEALAIGVKP